MVLECRPMASGMARRYDVAVIGGGLIGLATAYRLLGTKPGLRLAVLEKEPELARHQSGRSSVIHAGLYYRPGSLKALLCREGMELLKEFADEHEIPYQLCGKLVVAGSPPARTLSPATHSGPSLRIVSYLGP